MELVITCDILFWISFGFEPIFENLSVIIFNLFKSLSISFDTIFLSILFLDLMYSFQPINEERGVPNWWAVSLAKPVHSLSFSDLFE